MTRDTQRKGGLGRGLAALIPTGPAEDQEAGRTMGTQPMGAAAADVVIGTGRVSVAGDSAGRGTGLATVEPISHDVGAVYRELRPTQIQPNPQQPRTVFDEDALAELVFSIREFGLMQPIVVRRLPAPKGRLSTSW